MENNGRGVFYGVIGVATLIVAIIGATFAYFSASANTGYVLNTSGATMALAADSDTDGYKPNLIPVDETLATFPTRVGVGNDSEGKAYCVDMNGNKVKIAQVNTVDIEDVLKERLIEKGVEL